MAQRRLFILLFLTLAGSCGIASAQQRDVPTINALKEYSESGARSVVTLHQDARKAVDTYYANTKTQSTFKGFRIRLYAGNGQTARKSAESAIYAFRSRFNEPVYFTYDNPYFYVTCGNFLSNEEAIIFLAKVREFFPKALIVSNDIPAENITRRVAAQRSLDDGKDEEAISSIVEEMMAEQMEAVELDSVALAQRRLEKERKAREYDMLSRTMEILPTDTLSFSLPLDGEFYDVTLFPEVDSLSLLDPRLLEILDNGEEAPEEADKKRGKSGEWEYLDKPF